MWEAFPQNFPDPVQMRRSAFVAFNIPAPEGDCTCNRVGPPPPPPPGGTNTNVPIACPKGLVPVTSKSECLVAGKELGLINQPSRSFARVQGRFTLVTTQPKAPVLDAPSGTVGPIGCYVKERGNGAPDDQRFFFATASVGKKDAQLDGCCKRPFGQVTKLIKVVGDKSPAEFVNGLQLVCRNPNLKTRSVSLRRRHCL